jgi:HEPN domain-containing protein
MPPPSPAPGSPRDWLVRAQAKLVLARLPLPAGAMREDLCFWAQQAAELAIKAVYQQHGWLFPFIHDLAQLLNGLQQQGLTIPPDVQEAQKLSVYATLARYPGLTAPATEAHYNEAIKIAEDVVSWAESLVR